MTKSKFLFDCFWEIRSTTKLKFCTDKLSYFLDRFWLLFAGVIIFVLILGMEWNCTCVLIKMVEKFQFESYCPVNTVKVMSRQSVLTLYLGRLSLLSC